MTFLVECVAFHAALHDDGSPTDLRSPLRLPSKRIEQVREVRWHKCGRVRQKISCTGDVVNVVICFELLKGEDGPAKLGSWGVKSARELLVPGKREAMCAHTALLAPYIELQDLWKREGNARGQQGLDFQSSRA